MLSEMATPSVISAATGSGVGFGVAVGSGVGVAVGSGVAVGAAVTSGVGAAAGSACAGAPQAASSAQKSADIRRREIRFFVAGFLSSASCGLCILQFRCSIMSFPVSAPTSERTRPNFRQS